MAQLFSCMKRLIVFWSRKRENAQEHFAHEPLARTLFPYLTLSRFCPKHRDQQAIERAKVKEQITSNNMEGPQRKVSGKVSAPKDVAEGKHIRTSIETPVTRSPSSTSRATPKKHSPLTKSRTKPPTVTPTFSLGSKYSRRETPSTYTRPSVNAEDDNSQSSPKRARKSHNNEATAEELRVLKEYRSFSSTISILILT
jgi:hypothetical protein